MPEAPVPISPQTTEKAPDLRRRMLPYAVAVASVVLATLARLSLNDILGERQPFVTFYLAVLFTAWYGGLGPALLAAALGGLSAAHFILPPAGSLRIVGADRQIGFSLYLTVGLVIALLNESLRREKARAEARAQEARQAEEARRLSEERFATTLNSIGDAVIATDAEGRATYLNPVAEALTGWKSAEAAGRPLDEIFVICNETTREPVESPVTKVLREGRVVGLANHTVLIAKDGAERPIDDSGAPIRDSRGALTGVVLVFRDISERKTAEEAQAELATQVRQQGERLQSLVASVPGVVWEAWGQPDEAGQRINFVSEYVETMLGYTVEEWLATANFWLSIVHPDDREQAAANAAEHFRQGGDGTNTFRWLTKDGRALWVESHSTVIADAAGQPLGMRGVTMDITERKNAEEALRRSEEAERQFQAQLTELHAVTNLLFRAETLDDLCRMAVELGITRLGFERMGIWFRAEQPDRIRGSFGVDEQGRIRDERNAVVPIAPESLMGQVLAQQASLVSFSDTPIFNDNLVVVGRGQQAIATLWNGAEVIGAVSVDNLLRRALITEAQQKLLTLFAATLGSLCDRVRVIEALRRSEGEVRALNARLRRSMAETHHRIKNNLQVVSALAEMQAGDGQEMVPASALDRIGLHARALAAIHDLLTQAVKEDSETAFISSRAALDKLLGTLQGVLGSRPIRARVEDIRLPVRQVTGLTILVNEVIANAIKHGDGEIELQLEVRDGRVHLQVSDSGPGFPPAFDPTRASGMGLELIDSVSRWDLGGKIAYRNREPRGATLLIDFPLPEEAVVRGKLKPQTEILASQPTE